MKDTDIEWAHHTFNIVEGCTKVSEECQNCYAWVRDRRFHPTKKGARSGVKNGRHWGPKADRRTHGPAYWRQPLKWNREAQEVGGRQRVFCSSLADVFEGHPTVIAERAKLWPLIQQTPWLDWLLLTKRPEHVANAVPWGKTWPSNVWLGTTVGVQKYVDRRLSILAEVPAAIRFVSAEPLLEEVDLSRYLGSVLDWVIVGGEAGSGARPFDLRWAKAIVQQCARAGVACFVKQLGDIVSVDGNLMRKLYGPKGKVFGRWPQNLRVRQFPALRAT
jgi:protein gp37